MKTHNFQFFGLTLALSILAISFFSCKSLPTPSGIQGKQVDVLPIFPGAEGFGTNTIAGRGGKLLKVTNLNNDGPGSLREAIAIKGPRIIVFEVGGTINLNALLDIHYPFCTVAGQTAPWPGIMLKEAGIRVTTHDVLVQHLFIRPGKFSTSKDGIQILNETTYNVVIDHISVSWSLDENMSTWYSPRDITFSNSIIGEGLHSPGYGMLIGDGTINISVIGNLFINNKERGPLIKGGVKAAIINNLVYNQGSHTVHTDDYNSGPSYTNIVGNVYIAGPSTTTTTGIGVIRTVKQGTKIYQSDNIYAGGNILSYATSFNPYVRNPSFSLGKFKIIPSSSVERSVLALAGARPAERDEVDTRLVNSVKNRTGGRIISSQEDVGGWPDFPTSYQTFTVPDNPNSDIDGDGYSNIEELLHRMASYVERKNI